MIDILFYAATAGGKKKKKKKPIRSSDDGELIIDESSLSIDYHAGFVLALAMVEDILTKIEDDLRILLIGLGGGTLPTCLHKHFKKVSIHLPPPPS